MYSQKAQYYAGISRKCGCSSQRRGGAARCRCMICAFRSTTSLSRGNAVGRGRRWRSHKEYQRLESTRKNGDISSPHRSGITLQTARKYASAADIRGAPFGRIAAGGEYSPRLQPGRDAGSQESGERYTERPWRHGEVRSMPVFFLFSLFAIVIVEWPSPPPPTHPSSFSHSRIVNFPHSSQVHPPRCR